MSQPLDAAAYQQAAAGFGEVVTSLADHEWELVAHPGDWTVAATVAWVVVGDAQLSAAARGGAIHLAADFDAAVLGPNPVATWRGTAVAAIEGLSEAGTDATVEHPEGTLRLADLVAQRVTENLVRAWDIGRAVGRPTEISADLADRCLDFWADHARAVLAGGVLASTPIEPAADADSAARFLALLGRQP